MVSASERILFNTLGPTYNEQISLHLVTRPQRSWGKVIFSQASVILFTGGSASVHAWIPPPPPGPGTPSPWDQAPPPPSRHPPRSSRAYWEIRSTSGRYASYWNANLFIHCERDPVYIYLDEKGDRISALDDDAVSSTRQNHSG